MSGAALRSTARRIRLGPQNRCIDRPAIQCWMISLDLLERVAALDTPAQRINRDFHAPNDRRAVRDLRLARYQFAAT